MAASEQQSRPPETRIDQIWAEAQSGAPGEAEPTDAAAGRFLDALLAEGLICPIWSAQDLADGGAAPDGADADFAPIIVERDGVETFSLFDSVERLAESDLGAPEYVAAPGAVFFRIAAEAGAQIAFNPGVAATDTLFAAETVAMIAALSDAGAELETVGDGEAVEILAPAAPAEATLAALSARLAAASGLSGAWLVRLRRGDADPAEAPTLVLAVATDMDAESAELGALAQELSRLGGVLEPEAGLDVAILIEGERALEAAKKVGVGLL